MHYLADSQSTQSSIWSSPPSSECFCTQPKEETCIRTTFSDQGPDDHSFGLSIADAEEHLISSSQNGKCQVLLEFA